jgi:hypothetical protein
MEKSVDSFNFKEVLQQVWDAVYGIACHIVFDGAVHGLAIALILVAVGFYLLGKKHKIAKPFIAGGRKLAILCSIFALPGLVVLLTSGKLPPVGVYTMNSLGYIAFWSLFSAHLVGEELNYQCTVKKPEDDQEPEALANDNNTEILAEKPEEKATVTSK